MTCESCKQQPAVVRVAPAGDVKEGARALCNICAVHDIRHNRSVIVEVIQ